MVDGIKACNSGLSRQKLIDAGLVLIGHYYHNTGQIIEGANEAPWNGLKFKESENGVISIDGSLHKNYNGGEHNYDDFTFGMLLAEITKLKNKFGLDPSKVRLNGIEFGVNINPSFNPNDFIDSLLCYKYKRFDRDRQKGKNVASIHSEQYTSKIYNKGQQYGLSENILRFEIKITRMVKLEAYGIHFLEDLTDRSKLASLKPLLLDVFDNIIYCDDTIDYSFFSKRDAVLLQKGNNDRYWENHKLQTGSNSSKLVRQYQRLIRDYGKQNFHLVRALISDKWDYLINCDEIRVITDHDTATRPNRIRVFTNPARIPVEFENTSFYTLGNDVELIQPNEVQTKRCIITGHDISMQKPGSRFLNKKGLKHLYKNDRKAYDQLLLEIPPKWHKETLDIQFYKIAHHTRDLYTNSRNYNQKAIKKLCSQPALFNNYDLISEEKIAIANRP